VYADCYVSYPIETPFTYRVPREMELVPGQRARINFSGRVVNGYVVRVHDQEPSGYEVKDVLSVVDASPIFDSRLVELARYAASTYLSYPGEVLSMALPSGVSPSDRHWIVSLPDGDPAALNDEQEGVLRAIMAGGPVVDSHLLFGVTGSGKTEVYIEAARAMVERGRSVIYLVPEISLSSQIFSRLRSVFGDRLILYHSHLTGNQRLYNWLRFYRGEALVAVGTRSSIFLQCPDLGMIIIDEEHDGSYKEHSSPRYNARRIAFHRAREEGAKLVLGSATPSVESLFAAEKGIMRLHRLSRRFGGAALPAIEIVGINTGGKKGMLSPPLMVATRRAVEQGRQAVFLLNRRGMSPLLICDSCGATELCPHCNIGLSLHRGDVVLCHYCGFRKAAPSQCSQCGSRDVSMVGSGTQRIEDLIDEVFHSMRVFRLDQDSARKKGTVDGLIEKMNSREIDILLGTQMVAKGFDFPGVTVVGVLLADIGMNLPDFRAGERVFSLLMQVAGRSGRGADPGKVIIQTVNPENELFRYLRSQDYYGFYRRELETRRLLEYPPFTRMARVLARGRQPRREPVGPGSPEFDWR
jgi:primosomal protein N' (replication factor Y)